MTASFLVLVLCTQAPAAAASPSPSGGAGVARESGSVRVEALRSRIHGMRMDLLLGGEKVRQAETDAANFYRDRVELIDQRLDSVAGELTELHANYQSTLNRTLQSSGEARPAALREAAEQRGRIQALQAEEGELGERRGRVEKLIAAVEARGRERERLTTKIESYTEYGENFAMNVGGIGLAPEVEATPASSPLSDDGLIEDLLAVDALAARRVIFETDPDGYWRRFPLQPPEAILRKVMRFPPPDLPGQR